MALDAEPERAAADEVRLLEPWARSLQVLDHVRQPGSEQQFARLRDQVRVPVFRSAEARDPDVSARARELAWRARVDRIEEFRDVRQLEIGQRVNLNELERVVRLRLDIH